MLLYLQLFPKSQIIFNRIRKKQKQNKNSKEDLQIYPSFIFFLFIQQGIIKTYYGLGIVCAASRNMHEINKTPFLEHLYHLKGEIRKEIHNNFIQQGQVSFKFIKIKKIR